MNSRLRHIPLALTAAFLLAQIGGCDRRPVTAEKPGATNGLPKSASGDGGAAAMTGAKIYPAIEPKK